MAYSGVFAVGINRMWTHTACYEKNGQTMAFGAEPAFWMDRIPFTGVVSLYLWILWTWV